MDDEVNGNINYLLCCLSKSYKGCSVHKRTELSVSFKISDFSNEIEKGVTEGQLICSRNFLCAFHHQNYGRYCKAPQRYQHPEHTWPTINKTKVKDICKATYY